MVKKWYPVIDDSTCDDCGTPDVKNAEICVDHCHDCDNCCPEEAITYLGEDTGWTPPNGEQILETSCCSCGCETTSEKTIVVEYLYLDLKTCNRCIGTDDVLDEVMMVLIPALSIAGFKVTYNKIEMESAEIAGQHKFLSSPTIRVNGQDICQSVAENNCGCCSNISGTDVNCRVFEYDGELYEIPPKEMLAEAILKAVFGQVEAESTSREYELPENLQEFFEGKKDKSSCSCTGNCC